jgi:hypothetical protein
MTTYSTSLKLTLIGNGEQAGTWGTTTNTNFGTLLEQAITGVQTITMTDANYTLSNLDGTSDEARNPVLIIQGTNTAIRDVIAPVVNKQYLVYNNTSGGFSIRIIGATGSGVTIPNGARLFVYCDGTNFYTGEQNYTTGNFQVGGNLSVTGNTNAAAATYTGNVAVLNLTTANVTSTANITANVATFSGNSSFNGTGAVKVPVGTTAQQPTPTTGMIRFNSTDAQFEGYGGSQWSSIGGASAGGAIYENKQSITSNYTMSTNYNGESVGPITVASGVSVTIPSGSRWVIL